MTGNMQLSQKYKSSADLVSELLKKPVFTRYRSIKKKSASGGPRTKVSAGQGGMPTHGEEPVTESDEKMSGEEQPMGGDHQVEVTRVQLRLPATMRPRLATLASDTETSETSEVIGGWEVRPADHEATLTTPGDKVDSGDKCDDVTTSSNKTNPTNTTTSDKSSVSTNTVSFMPDMIDLSLFINYHGVICHVVNIIPITVNSTVIHFWLRWIMKHCRGY